MYLPSTFGVLRSAEQALKYGLIDKIIAVNEKKRDDYDAAMK